MAGIVLVAEDEHLSQRLVTAVIEYCGLTARITDNGRDCLNLLNEGLEPSLILLDLEMPTMGGIEFLSALKAFPKEERCPIVVFTANNQESIVLEAIRLGAEDFIVKPFKTSDLAQRIKDLTYAFNEADLAVLLHKLPIQDDRLHDVPSLHQRIGTGYNLYPFVVTNKKMCIAIPRGMSPQVVARLDHKDLVEQISIFRNCATGWRKVWPRSSKMTGRLSHAG